MNLNQTLPKVGRLKTYPSQNARSSKAPRGTPRLAATAFLVAVCVWLTGCQSAEQNWPAWPEVGGPSPAPANATPNRPVTASTSSSVVQPPSTAVTSNPTAIEPTQAAPATVSTPGVRLTQGDVIQVTFDAEPTLNTAVKVQLDGSVALPMVGNVPASGKTLYELQTDLKERYKQFLKINDLNVTLVTTTSSVYVSGAVARPGPIPLTRPLTALEAILEAGGFTPQAKSSSVMVLRMVDGKRRSFQIDLKAALKKGEADPFELKPFDIIHVPEKTFNF